MGIIDAIGSFFKAGWALLTFQSQRQALNNSPEMKANAVAKTDTAIVDQATLDVNAAAKGDLDQIRKDAAE